jgi:hypothetical protein
VLTCPLLLFVLPPCPGPFERGIATAGAVLALTFGALLYWLARRIHRPWFGFLCGALDVTLVSAASVASAALGGHQDWSSLYVLAIAGASLRRDSRLSICTGLVAMAQNAGLAVAGGVSPAILAYQQAVLVGSTITSAAIVSHLTQREHWGRGTRAAP